MTSEYKQPNIDKSNRVLLGVCSGLARSFGVPVFWVRALACVALFTWGLAILVYLGMYFVMNHAKPTMSNFADDINSSRAVKHVKRFKFKKNIYKNRAKGKIKGVCAGLAEYFEIPTFFVRLGFLGSLFFGPFAIIAYIVCAFLLDDKPSGGFFSTGRNPDEDEHPSRRESKRRERHRRNQFDEWDARYGTGSGRSEYSKAHASANLSDMDTHFEDLEKKLQRIEATITSKKFKLHSELKKMS